MTNKPRKYGPVETVQRIKQWCDLQERAQQEVRDKLYQWGIHRNEVESVIAELISGNYLNEERFARAYVSGKFRIKRWGRNKIVHSLKYKQISSYCIRLGLREIDEDEYSRVIHDLIEKKSNQVKSTNPLQHRHKIAAYLVQRGYEPDLVWQQLNNLQQD